MDRSSWSYTTIRSHRKWPRRRGTYARLESKFGETAVMSGALWQRFHGDNGTRRKRSELKAAVDAQSTNEDVESTKMDKGRDLYKNSDVGDINEDI